MTSPDRAELVRRWYEAGYYAASTIGEELASATTDGDVVFARAEGDEETHRVSDLRARARRMAAGLTAAGVRPGDVVAVQAPTSPDQLALMAAVWTAGAVLLPVVDIYGHAEVSFILRQSGARHLIVPTEWRGRRYAEEALGWNDVDLDAVIAIGEDHPDGTLPASELDGAHEATPAGVDADDVALLVYTSGTTSDPKGVQHTHNSLLAGGFRSPDPMMAALVRLGTFPAGHIAGVLASLSCLFSGGTNVIMDRWSARLAAELIERHGVMMSSGTPFYLATLLDEAERTGRDISTLKAFLSGAAAVPPALLERAKAYGLVSWRSYGSTEHPVISGGGPDHSEYQRHYTDGAVVPGAEVRIAEDGEILVRGPKLFVGYRDEALDDAAFEPGGWFRTGDIGHLDADGHLTITDRKKDLIIRGGENVSSKEVEDLLAQHPAVSEAAVCAAPDDVFGEQVCAFVILRPGRSLDLDDVARHFATLEVARQKIPTRLEVVDDLPRTASGKVRKVDLRAIAAAS